MCKNYFDSTVPEQKKEDLPETKTSRKMGRDQGKTLKHFDNFEFSQGLEQVSEFYSCNQ